MRNDIIENLAGLATTPRFTLLLWDLALMSETEKPLQFRTAFNTGVNAINCFKQYCGIPQHEKLLWFGNVDIGYIIEPESGFYAAKYHFSFDNDICKR